jgi:hypothetical protein
MVRHEYEQDLFLLAPLGPRSLLSNALVDLSAAMFKRTSTQVSPFLVSQNQFASPNSWFAIFARRTGLKPRAVSPVVGLLHAGHCQHSLPSLFYYFSTLRAQSDFFMLFSVLFDESCLRSFFLAVHMF